MQFKMCILHKQEPVTDVPYCYFMICTIVKAGVSYLSNEKQTYQVYCSVRIHLIIQSSLVQSSCTEAKKTSTTRVKITV